MLQQVEWSDEAEPFVGHATILRPPAYFESKCQLEFVEAVDGLDRYKGALLLKDNSIKVALKRYRLAPPGTTNICLSQEYQDIGVITALVAEIVADLGLQQHDLMWQRKDSPDA